MTNRTFLRFRIIAQIAALFVAGIVSTTQAQQFTLQNPIPTPSQLNGIQAVGGGIIYAAGNYNTLVQSTNGGATWSTQTGDLDALNSFQGIYFQSSSRGWAYGGSPINGASIEFTNNGGALWGRQLIQSANTVTDVYFQSSTQGWAIGTGHEFATPSVSKPFIFYSSDIGNTWNRQIAGVPSTTNDYMITIGFANNATGWAIGYDPNGDFMLKTTNSGTQWNTQMTFGVGTNLSNMLVTSITNMYVVGDASGVPEILTTTNGGSSWNTFSFPSVTGHLLNIAFPTAMVGYAGGWKTIGGLNQPYVLKTTNGGASWTEATANANWAMYNPTFTGMSVADANTVYLSGNYNGGLVVGTTDGGNTWGVQSYNAAAQNGYHPAISAVSFSDTLNGWAVGSNRSLANSNQLPVLLTTTNGGVNWVPRPLPQYTNALFTGISSVSTSTIWITGYDYVANSSFVLSTTNGGAQWSSSPTPGESAFTPSDISFSSASSGVLAGSGAGKIYYTTNGGSSWTASTFTNYTPNNVFKVGSFYGSNVWVCADNGTELLNSTNGGQTWTGTSSNSFGNEGNQYWVTGVSFIPSGIYGWISGWEIPSGSGSQIPFISYTTNSGQSWTQQGANIKIPNSNYSSSCGCNLDTTISGQFNDVQDIIAVSQLGAVAVTNRLNDSPYPGNRILATQNGGGLWLAIDSMNTGTDYNRIIAKLTSRIDAWTLSTANSGVAEIRHGKISVPRFTATPNTLFSTTILSYSPTDSAVQSVKITNFGTSVLSITSTSITSTSGSAGDYTIIRSPGSIAAGATDSISVKFKPLSFGEADEGLGFTATLNIFSNAIDTPSFTVSLLGSSGEANVESSPSSLFGTTIVPINGASDTGTVYVRNSGRPGIDAILEVGTPVLSENTDYVILRSISHSIAPGGSDSMLVMFKPTSGGAKSGTLIFTTNTRTNPTITVTLGGIGGVRLFAANKSSFAFTDTVQCAPMKDSVIITNTGTLSMTIDTPLVILGSAASDITTSLPKANVTVPPGGNITVYVTYTPTHYGMDTITMSMTNNSFDTTLKTFTIITDGLEGFLVTKQKTIIDTIPYNSPLTKYIVLNNTGNVPVFIQPTGVLPGEWQISLALPFPDVVTTTDSIGIYHKATQSNGTWDTLVFVIPWGNNNSTSSGFGCGPQGFDTVTIMSFLAPNPSSVREENLTATSFALLQNYPNPFTFATTVEYSIPENSFVTLTVFDGLGREVKQLVRENEAAGVYTTSFDATSLPVGTYFYELRSGENMKRMMMTVVK